MAQLSYGSGDEHQKNIPPSGQAPPFIEHKRENPVVSPPLDVSNGHQGVLDYDQVPPLDVSNGHTVLNDDDQAFTMPKYQAGYTSFGINESVDENSSDRSLGIVDEGGRAKETFDSNSPHEAMAKEVQDHLAETAGGAIDVKDLKGDFVDLSEDNTKDQFNLDDGPKDSPMEEREDEQGLIDVHSLKEKLVDMSEGNTDQLKVGDDQKRSGDFQGFQANHVDRYKKGVEEEGSDHEKTACGNAQGEGGERKSCEERVMPHNFGSNEYEPHNEATKSKDVEGFGEKISERGDEKFGVMKDDVDVYPGQSGVGEGVKDVGKLGKGLDDGKGELLEEPAPIVPRETGDDGLDDGVGDLLGEPSPNVPIGTGDVNKVNLGVEDNGKGYVPEEKKEQFTEHIKAPVNQDAGLNVREFEDKDHGESPYTGFDRTEEYVKEGYGEKGFVPKNNEDIDWELLKPTETVEEEMGRRPADDNPLDVETGFPNEMKIKEASEGEVKRALSQYGAEGSNDTGEGPNNMGMDYTDVPPQPASLPHPRAQDVMPAVDKTENDGTGNQEEEQQQRHAKEGGHKKGVFEKIKEKLTPPH